jgi:hypothetical protein
MLTRHKVLVGLIFLVGCATGGVASQVVAPPAAAAATVQRWDYFCDGDEWAGREQRLKAAGQQGWELVAFAKDTACYKRPL